VSSREDRGRYRGRRRAATPPRARYAAVATTAFVGAGLVALGAAQALPDSHSGSAAFSGGSASLSANTVNDRQATVDRANRANDRGTAALANSDQPASDYWLLPLKYYSVSSTFGSHPDGIHPGLDLASPEGTQYFAAHAGTVTMARWDGSLGYTVVIDAGNGYSIVYGHSSRLLVQEGQKVQAGDVIGLTGDTGYSFTPGLHFEVRQNGAVIDPVAYLLAHGVDINNKTQAVDS
jgi:murein DD-endopeptidase MepM/ murein hydrolase activator NlpD